MLVKQRILFLLSIAIVPCLLVGVFHHVGDYNVSSTIHMVMQDSLAYMSCRNSGLSIINVSDPANPVLTGSIGSSVLANCSALYNNYLVVPTTNSYLKVLNVANPSTPQVVGSCSLSEFGQEIAVNDNYAYVAGSDSLHIIHLINPAVPVQVASFPIIPWFQKILIRDGILYILSDDLITLYSLANPTSPQIISTVNWTESAVSMALMDDYLYIGIYEGTILVYDISNMAVPAALGTMDTGYNLAEIYIAENRLYATCGDYGLQVFQMPSPTSIQYQGCYLVGPYMDHLIIRDNLVYASIWKYGLLVIDCSSADFAPYISNVPTPSTAKSLVANGDYLYVAAEFGIITIDKSDSENPVVTNTYYSPSLNHIIHTALNDNILYANGDSRVQLFNLFDPSMPSSMSFINTPLLDFCLNGNLLYGTNNGLYIYDVSNPWTPQIVIQYMLPATARYLALAGSYVYCTTYYNDSIYILNVSNPASPVLVTTITMDSDFITGIRVDGSLAVVSCNNKICLLDISNPAQPVIVSTILLDWDSSPGIGFFSGGILLVSEYRTNHIRLYNLSNPLSPELVSDWGWNLNTNYMLWEDGKLYTSNYALGVSILDYALTSIPEEPHIPTPDASLNLKCYPNPFTQNININISGELKTPAELAVYNIKGQKIRTWSSVSSKEIIWDGLDDRQSSVSSGIYFVRLNTGSKSLVTKILKME